MLTTERQTQSPTAIPEVEATSTLEEPLAASAVTLVSSERPELCYSSSITGEL